MPHLVFLVSPLHLFEFLAVWFTLLASVDACAHVARGLFPIGLDVRFSSVKHEPFIWCASMVLALKSLLPDRLRTILARAVVYPPPLSWHAEAVALCGALY